MPVSCLVAAVLALTTPGAAVAQNRPAPAAAVDEQAGAPAIANAFAIESLVLMTGELQAALEANGDDLVRASPYLDLIYARYSARGDAIAERLARASDALNAGRSPEFRRAEQEAIDQFRLLPDQTLARVVSRQFGSENEDSQALSLARRLGRTLHDYSRTLIAEKEGGAPASSGRVTAETRAIAPELANLLALRVVANDPDQRASIPLVTQAVLSSPEVIRAQVAEPAPDAGAALVVAYAVSLRLLSEDIAEAERRLRLSAPGPDRALVVREHQPRLVEAAERAHVIGLALSAVSPASLSPTSLAGQRQETLRWIDLTALRGRIDQEGD